MMMLFINALAILVSAVICTYALLRIGAFLLPLAMPQAPRPLPLGGAPAISVIGFSIVVGAPSALILAMLAASFICLRHELLTGKKMLSLPLAFTVALSVLCIASIVFRVPYHVAMAGALVLCCLMASARQLRTAFSIGASFHAPALLLLGYSLFTAAKILVKGAP